MATIGTLAIRITANAVEFEKRMTQVSKTVRRVEREFGKSSRRMQQIGQQWTLGVTAPIVLGMTAVSKAALDWEDSFAGVRKTVDATEGQLADLDGRLRQMTHRIPLTHQGIAEIAEAAGQLGIRVENIESFTETMAMLGTATNMSATDSAMSLAQLDNIMQSGQRSFDRYGATIVHLGNNLATTESKITDFGLRIAGAGRIAGLHESQVLAIGGAFASVGVEAEAGGTAVSKVLADMTEAVATGGRKLDMFAATAGLSATQFATLWQQDAGEAFTRFVEGLGAAGDQAFGILRELGLNDRRLSRSFLSVAGSGDLLRRSIEMSSQAWVENIALTEEASKRFETGRSRLIMVANRARTAAIAFGEGLAPILERMMGRAERFTQGLMNMGAAFDRLPSWVRSLIANFLILLALIGPVTWGLGLLNRTIAGAVGIYGQAAEFLGKVVAHMAAAKVGFGKALIGVIGPTRLWIMAISAVVVAGIWLLANWEQVRNVAARIWSGISSVVLYAGSLIVRGIGVMVSALAALLPGLRSSAQAMFGWADSIRASAQAAWQSAVGGGAASAIAESAEQIAESGAAAADGQLNLADGIDEVGKAVTRNLQSFDQVHTLEDGMGSALDGFQLPDIELPDFSGSGAGGGITDAMDAMTEAVGRAGERLKNIWATILENEPMVKAAIEGIGDAFIWVKDNWETLEPIIGAGMVALGVAAIGMGIRMAAGWLIGIGPIGWVILAIAALTGVIVYFWDDITGWFDYGWGQIQRDTRFWWDLIQGGLSGDLDRMSGAVETWLGEFGLSYETVWNNIHGEDRAGWAGILQRAARFQIDYAQKLTEIGSAARTWATNLGTTVANAVIGVINAMISGVEGGINWAVRALNTFVEGINSVIAGLNEVPGVNIRMVGTISEIRLGRMATIGVTGVTGGAGGSAGMGMSVSAFASGGIVHPTAGGTLGLIGEAGRSEAVVPLPRGVRDLGDLVPSEEAVERAVYRALASFASRQSQSGTDGPREIVLEVDGQRLARVQLPRLNQEAQRQGLQLILREG